MDAWIELSRGPLFRIAFAILVVGVTYQVTAIVAQIVVAWRRAGDRALPTKAIATATLRWLIPVRILKARPVYSIASVLFHGGIILVPLTLVGHAALLGGYLPGAWPKLHPLVADVLTILSACAIVALLVGRLGSRSSRALSKFQDYAVLVVLLLLVLSGFLASHPVMTPIDARALVLVHMLLGDLTLILLPTTKIVHCVLYPFLQLLFEVGWHFPEESGRHVAIVLGKESEPV